MQNMEILKPSFYDKFQCIGGECKRTCCAHWKIELTKEEFKNTKRRIQSQKMKDIFANAFQIRDKTTGKKTDLYSIKLKEDGTCPFLNEGGLCRIYIECGPETMSKTCQIFPRRTTIFQSKRANLCLSLGCEEVVRLLLQETDGVRLEKGYEEVNMLPVNRYLNQTGAENINKYFYDVQTLLFGVLQNREYTMGQRMVLLGMALQKINIANKSGKLKEIPSYVMKFLQQMDIPEAKKTYETFFEKKQTNGVLRANHTLMDFCMGCRNRKDIGNMIQEIFERLHVQQKMEIKGIFAEEKEVSEIMEFDVDKYLEAEIYFTKYLKEHPYFLENIMVAVAWYNEYPYISGSSIWEGYCIFAMIYSIYRFILVAYITPSTTEEDIIDCIVAVSRVLLHYRAKEEIAKILEKNNSATLAHMAMLVL